MPNPQFRRLGPTYVYLGPDVLAFRNERLDGRPVTVLANLGTEPVALPAGAEVLVASGRLEGGRVPQDCTVWLA